MDWYVNCHKTKEAVQDLLNTCANDEARKALETALPLLQQACLAALGDLQKQLTDEMKPKA